LIYLASFSFYVRLTSAFFYYFFLYSLMDLAFTYAIFCLSIYSSSFLRFLSSSFCLASSSLWAIITSFFWLMVSLNSSFFFMLTYLFFSSSSLRSRRTSASFCCNWSRVISSSRPIETNYISCFGRARIFFSSSLI
jgi:hypothetical protein